MRGQMLQESSARSVLLSTSISLYGQVKRPIRKNDIQAQARWFQPLLMTEVGKRLSADAGSAPTFNMAAKSFWPHSAAMFFPSLSLVAANSSEQCQEIRHILSRVVDAQNGVLLAFRFGGFSLGFPTLFCGASLSIVFTFCLVDIKTC